jgi:hypothetical protein
MVDKPEMISIIFKRKMMKRIITLCAVLCASISGFSQSDSTSKGKPDTIHIGGITIIRKAGSHQREIVHDRDYRHRYRTDSCTRCSNVSTNWWIFDIGFSNYSDNSDYSSGAAQAYAPGINSTWLALKGGRSRNVNIWIFMQKLNVAKHVLNLKYGLGLELNNYFYKRPVRYDANPPAVPDPPVLSLDNTVNRTYKKDKLAADYLTVPLMLNLNFTPHRSNGFGFSGGISVGYLYSSRNKFQNSDEGKRKVKDDFGLEKWKLSYVAELSLGPVRFYGSYAFKSMYERGLDITPYNFGFRLSNW